MPILRVTGRTEVFLGDAWAAALAVGCASVGLGVALLVWPDKSVRVGEYLFALTLLLTAAWQLVVTFRARIRPGLRVPQFLTAVLTVLLALWCARSGDSVPMLAMWVGMGWTIHGIMSAIVAVWSEDVPGSGRREVLGLLTLLGGLIIVVWPIDTLTALAALVGVCSILLGGSQIHTAAEIGRAVPSARRVRAPRLAGARGH
ncbi:DUF308 domain-containing protein [Nocardia sp. NPDC004068]|uniref:DUF308 domain-containing protein n=1 Tax=Nocardia sp. NPDC004068 TaxID=3364303 RepID=UPI00369AE91E